MDGWSYRFDSSHKLNENAWGVTLETEDLISGLMRYTLEGICWAQTIPAGGSVKIGFNGIQGTDLGSSGELTGLMLLGDVFNIDPGLIHS